MDNPVFRDLRSTLGVGAAVVGPILAILIAIALAQAPKQIEAEPEPKLPWQLAFYSRATTPSVGPSWTRPSTPH